MILARKQEESNGAQDMGTRRRATFAKAYTMSSNSVLSASVRCTW